MEPKNNSDRIKIRISQLSTGIHEYHFHSEPAEIGLENDFRKPVIIDVVLDKTPRQIFLRAVVRTSGIFQCDRCIEEFEQELSNNFTMFYVYDEVDAGGRGPEEMQVISADTTHIDLTDDGRQTVLLAVPLKLLCREGCKGLCPHCGANRNLTTCDCTEEITDPRWDGLRDLLSN